MTTMHNRRILRKRLDHVTPDDRLRHSAGMGLGEPSRDKPRSGVVFVFVLVLVAVLVRLLNKWIDF